MRVVHMTSALLIGRLTEVSEAKWHVCGLVCHGHTHEIAILLTVRDILCAVELATAEAMICAKSKMTGPVAVQSVGLG